MNTYAYIIDVFLHLDKYLGTVINNYGFETYLILFLIIFLETGLVVTPFLPGDSLIFAAATFAALGALNIYILVGVLMVAAILGDTANYEIGRHLGEKLIKSERLIKKEHIEITNKFYEKHGGKTIIFARFVPIVRTLAPFVAGIGKMSYRHFISFNALGGILWVLVVSICGYFFGNIPVVKENFTIVVIGIIVISILPGIIGFVKSKMNKYNEVV
ncbi:DedA family protein [Clostridium saccharobutylicum]|uniref:Protein DedA n=1 Tax=Clostridium saccharobutylicum DSM 13864 TaxID=1345695 RepID=U5MNJ5_CLOSA|nr:DedA family protein [Clostridium saccharobutylicum]AGX42165.1 protein DedA [Clostridium saccharobutylicum DSM 13864]AQR89445.1 inner membrane protein YghB [Clostridium saccharobutylicum]AQR99347.1 inner membrane protein YghB [Clostridium saccharobutylicum]AQS09078.1 inner membrane protein YghB [Clostridium saccharobutylicum]AQS13333.1 inner membrane protein YghB [Clostridium saccharobutylicum]